ncbi:MAG TPA: anaerobic sulfatase maturase [Chitinispirillaceae bacterium]|nr:anaerobic sulfatase maturase [Chitinispirillaceae bacterium]
MSEHLSCTTPAFHVMAKPAGARCNMRCDYCFYLKKKQLYPDSRLQMSEDIMKRYIRQTVRSQSVRDITIAWQGGEPTLMGISFYQRALAIQKNLSSSGVRIHNTIQTNGITIDEKWCDFFRKNNFLVGLSIDGPKVLHDCYRKDIQGRSVFSRVLLAAKLMKRFGVEFNILCTVNAVNSCHPLDVYRFFRDELNACYLQFIPIVERANNNGEQNGTEITKRSVQPEMYGHFLTTIFDEWVRRDVGTMFIQIFDGVLASYVCGYSTLCVLQPTCGLGVALEHNGDVYSCDHFVEPDYLLGNIKQTSIGTFVSSEKQRSFGIAKSATLPNCCKSCEFLFTCHGECPKNRIFDAPDTSGKINWLCSGLKQFFEHTKNHMQIMASLLKEGKDACGIMHSNHFSPHDSAGNMVVDIK